MADAAHPFNSTMPWQCAFEQLLKNTEWWKDALTEPSFVFAARLGIAYMWSGLKETSSEPFKTRLQAGSHHGGSGATWRRSGLVSTTIR